MPWSVKYHSDIHVVETRYEGLLRPDDLRSAVQATLELAAKQGTTRFLGDCTVLKGGHSVVDLYRLVDLLEAYDAGRQLREAIVTPLLDVPTKDVQLWETAVTNRGFRVRLFENRDEALNWLCGSDPS